jgi:hypothetical protein
MSKKPIIELVLTDEEAEIFAVARAAGDGLRRSFDAWVSIGRATQIARKHADAPGGTHRTRGARFRAILDEQGLTPSYRHCSGQALPRRLLAPVRPRVGTDNPTPGAHHPRAERWHRNVIRHGSALKIVRWWHCQHDTASDRTPLARMLPSVMGGPA